MAEEAREYTLIDAEGNSRTSSRNYTGKGTANYPNGDTYTGDFLDGVSIGSAHYWHLFANQMSNYL